jgi:hypothetical protein
MNKAIVIVLSLILVGGIWLLGPGPGDKKHTMMPRIIVVK